MQILSLVLSGVSILTISFCLFLSPPLAIAGLVIAWTKRRSFREGREPVETAGITQAAYITGWIATGLSVAAVIVVMLALGALIVLPFIFSEM